MAIMHSANSDSVDPGGSVFTGDRLVASFPRHDIVKLDEGSFVQWQQQVRFILAGYDLLGFLDGSLTAPPRFFQAPDGSLSSNLTTSIFTQQDNLLTSWLLSTIHPSFLSSFTDVRTASDVWIMATSLFAADTSTKQSQIRHELHSLKKGSLSVRAYVDKIKCLCALLAVSGSPISEVEHSAVLFAGLYSDFEGVSRAVQDVVAAAHYVEGSSPLVEDGSARGGRSSVRGRGHGFSPRLQCQICSRYGHLAQRCYYRYHRDEQSPVVTSQGGVVSGSFNGLGQNCFPGQNYNGGQNCSLPSFIKPNLEVDTMAPRGPHAFQVPFGPNSARPSVGMHYAHNGGHFGSPSLGPCVGDGDKSMTGHARGPIGTDHDFGQINSVRPRLDAGHYSTRPSANCVHLDLRVSPTAPEVPWRTKPRARLEAHRGVRILELLFMCVKMPPTFIHPVRIQFAAENNVFFEFHPSYCVVKDIQTQEILLRGQVRDGLYHFSAQSVALRPSAYNAAVQDCSASDANFILWHKRLGHLSSVIVKTILDQCQIPFNKKCLDHKSQAVDCFLQFQKMILTQFRKSIKKFQSDWGGEFHAFASVLADNGIIHRLTCPYTSEQNGVAERKHLHIVETGLTLLAQANLPMAYWGYAFCSAVHLINRLLTQVLNGHSPYQRLYGHTPTYDHLQVFGCCCFPYLCPFVTHKLDFQSQPSTFLGYSSQHKGYFYLTPEGKVIISRHVVFDESRFLSPAPITFGDLHSSCTNTYLPVIRPVTSTKPRRVLDTKVAVTSPARVVSSCAPYGFPPASLVSPVSASGSRARTDSSSSLGAPSSPVSVSVPAAGVFKPKVLAVDTSGFEPVSVEEALAHPDWRLAVQAEYDALIANSTWELRPFPPDCKAIGCKWLFKVKTNPDGSIARRKARLVAKGCSQVPGCDFKETFSPVVKPATIRIILSIAVTKGWSLRQVDVNNAFLNGDLTEEVFMQQPPGFVQSGPSGERLVCCLTKALYGLRQAPRAWFHKLEQFLVSIGFIQSKSDASLFVRSSSTVTLYVLVYVDDIVITGSSSDEITCFVQQLHNKFALEDMGELHYFLGIEVSRSSSGNLHVSQRKYIRELLDRGSMSNAKSVPTPMVSSSVLSNNEGTPLTDPTEYRSLAGALQYIILTRPDIAYAVNRVCQFMHAPTTSHMVALKRILRYLHGTSSHGLVFRRSDRLSLVGYADANWGLDFDDRRSTTGYCVYFGHSPVSWSSKRQSVISRSTAEAEYHKLAATTSGITWLVSLLAELNV
ncbi:hypothetical protein CXB51_028363 [Gossypium anomalum]|uniref:Integrase catalytic domain-containing protein n=1 Tax=Gossypium anomalum TaxID=47600 RepID=A0A8J5YYH0_9ROSI|nr:hypothetical protein CXB51_028363 [Gossypium anomalum]